MLNAYVFCATFLFLFLGVIWKTSNVVNNFLKFLFYGMAIWGVVNSLHELGFIVKV